jgi:hypothetical protein
VLRRVEASGALDRVREAQVNVVNMLLRPERMARLLEAEAVTDDEAYPLGAMLENLRDGIWRELETGEAIGPYRRNLQRGYLERMDYLLSKEAQPDDLPDGYEDYVIDTPVNVRQSDIRAYVRRELRTLREAVEQGLRRTSDEATRVHLQDVLARIEDIRAGEEESDA